MATSVDSYSPEERRKYNEFYYQTHREEILQKKREEYHTNLAYSREAGRRRQKRMRTRKRVAKREARRQQKREQRQKNLSNNTDKE